MLVAPSTPEWRVGGEDTRKPLLLVRCLGPEQCHLGVIFTPSNAGNRLSAPRIDARSMPPTQNVIQDALTGCVCVCVGGVQQERGSRERWALRREASEVGAEATQFSHKSPLPGPLSAGKGGGEKQNLALAPTSPNPSPSSSHWRKVHSPNSALVPPHWLPSRG